MPQHTKRTRFRRKELRQPDEFETLTGRAVAWARERRQLALGVLGAAAAVALIVLIVSRVGASRTAAAADAFRGAYTTFQAGKFADAAEAFSTVARDYPRTAFGRLAGLYRGHAFARQNAADDAATAYVGYLATSPEPYLRQEALAGLGRAKEASGDPNGALEAYAEAGGIEGPFRSDASLSAARLHEAAGQPDQAREIYARLLKEAPDPELRALLVTKLPPGSQEANDPGVAAATR